MTTPRPLATMRVLVADDNRDAADLLVELLRMDLGCQVMAVYDGRSAVQLALAEHHDVLILDVRMPGLGGIDVVREIDRLHRDLVRPIARTLYVAVTGKDATAAMPDIDGCFDAAFAKPVDGGALVELLRGYWHGSSASKAAGGAELSDLLCQVARKAGPTLGAEGHPLSFDYQGPRLVLDGDESALGAGLHRLICGLVDMVGDGFVVFKSAAQREDDEEWSLVAHVAAAGTALQPAAVDEVLRRLGLVDLLEGTAAGVAARTAVGNCPRSGAAVHCLIVPPDGVLFRFELRVRPLEILPDATADARGARAWIVDPHVVPSAMLQRRLQRLGWQVRRFDSFTQAQQQAARLRAGSVPALLVVMAVEQDDAVSDLRALLPGPVRCVRVVAIGSAALAGRNTDPVSTVHVDPLSANELIELTNELDRDGTPSDPGPSTASVMLQDRPRLLVVDDVEVNRIVAEGLATALGYEVETVADGLDAIRHCRLTPPDVVLMDVNMPVLGGIEATQRIRHLQRLGEIPPFPVLAATANDDALTRDRCAEGGMDGFVSKPLALDVLAEELRRVTLNAPP